MLKVNWSQVFKNVFEQRIFSARQKKRLRYILIKRILSFSYLYKYELMYVRLPCAFLCGEVIFHIQFHTVWIDILGITEKVILYCGYVISAN